MVIEQQITGAIIAGIKELYGADVTASQVQLQKTKKEFKGHLTLVVFPFLRMSKKSPEQTAQEIGEYLLRNEPAVAEFNHVCLKVALQILRRWIIYNLPLLHELEQEGYRARNRLLSPKQVATIIHFLGEP